MKHKNTARYDERDTIFSRMNLLPGTKRYQDYYSGKADQEETDKQLRRPGKGVFSDKEPENSIVTALFSFIAKLRKLVHPEPSTKEKKTDVDCGQVFRELKELASTLGAADFGVCRSREDFFYSVRGRGDQYGKPVPDILPYTVVLLWEMDQAKTAQAPSITETAEVARVYLEAAKGALALAEYAARKGYRAKAHIDGESEIVMPPAAQTAGLGAIGRHGLLVHPKLGSRVRLSAVTTDLPLRVSPPSRFNIQSFCDTCRACSRMCPKKAIPGGSADEDGTWGGVDHEACYKGWREFGSDCGVCLAVCPFSGKPGTQETAPGEPGFLKSYMIGSVNPKSPPEDR
jgi:ferredoxin